MKYQYLILYILLISLFSCNKTEIENKIIHEKKDSIKIQKLFDSLKNYNAESTDSTAYFLKGIEKEIGNIVSDSLLPFYLNEIGKLLYSKSEFRFSEEYFLKAFELYKNSDKEIEAAQQLSNIGVIKEIYGEYDQAVEIYLKALKIFQKNNDEKSCKLTFNNLGIVYETIENNEKALEYYFKALNIKDNSETGGAYCLNNIGVVFDKLNKPDSALLYYKKALSAYEAENDFGNIATVLNNIGLNYMNKNKNDSAFIYFSKSSEIFEANYNTAGLLKSKLHTAELYFKTKDYENTINILLNCIEKAESIEFNEVLSEFYYLLSQAYEEKKDYKHSVHYLKKYYSLSKSVILGI